MEIRESREGEFVVLSPAGRLDTKTSHEFEKKVIGLLDGGTRRFVIDLTDLEHISSAGLRVLLMLAKKLNSVDGHLALCGLSQAVRQIFDIAGFTSIFLVAPSQAAAIRSAPTKTKSAEAVELAAKILGLSKRRRAPLPESTIAGLAARAARLLGVEQRGPAGPPPTQPPAAAESSKEKREDKKGKSSKR